MLKNYLNIAWRNLLKNKAFSFLNISGLAIGMASAVLILLWVQNEVSYDRFHENQDNIYEAWNRGQVNDKIECWNSTPKDSRTDFEKGLSGSRKGGQSNEYLVCNLRGYEKIFNSIYYRGSGVPENIQFPAGTGQSEYRTEQSKIGCDYREYGQADVWHRRSHE